MTPPPEARLDTSGAGIDVPLPPRADHGVHWPVVVFVATLLGLVSSALAWQFTISLGRPAGSWRWLLILNCTYWYTWALFTPVIVLLSQRFRFERQGLLKAVLVHVPAVLVFSLSHIAAMEGVRWWLLTSEGRRYDWWVQVRRSALQNFDWEMMTYWAIVGLSHSVLYYRESRERALRAAQLETKLVEAHLQRLQQQLHPHFLFNTLHAISTLMHRDVEAADQTLTRLSDLLRMTLDNLGQQEVTLKAELDFLSKYLQIEQTRFTDRLVIRFDVQAEALDTLVPNMLLQPLAENAIKHGISRKAGPGHLDITARREGEKLWMEVRDDGVGLSEDALTALQKGIGVSTTRARLHHLFGADYRFEFHRQTGGLAVVVVIPWRIAAEHAETIEGAQHEKNKDADSGRRAVGAGTVGQPARG